MIRNKTVRRLLGTATWVQLLVSAWCFLRIWVAPDVCLDLDGSFDYVAWRCSWSESHRYIDVPIYEYLSFWAFVASAVFTGAAASALHGALGLLRATFSILLLVGVMVWLGQRGF